MKNGGANPNIPAFHKKKCLIFASRFHRRRLIDQHKTKGSATKLLISNPTNSNVLISSGIQ